VVIGYDLNEGYILLHSGLVPRKKESLRLFNNTWKRSGFWGLLVLPPSRAPISADENQFIDAIIGLEKTQNWQAAIQAYQTALGKWPDSKPARIGLGNGYYESGRLDMAEKVLRETTIQFPSFAMAYNNLAQVLFEQGKKEAALSAAKRAVNIGGRMKAAYQKTLETIQTDLQ
jgi:predicted Zn-dependent protease